MEEILYELNGLQTLSQEEVCSFLQETDSLVIPKLSDLVNLEDYARKLVEKAVIVTARDKGNLIGLSALYFNKAPDYSYSPFTMVKREYQRYGLVGWEMMDRINEYAKSNGSAGLRYEIRKSNKPLLTFHLRWGARIVEERVYPNTDVVALLMEITF